MYLIERPKLIKAKSLFANGESVRWVAAEIGIAPMTAWRIQKLTIQERGTIYCACGKPVGHKGWCGFRIARYGAPWRFQLKDKSKLNIYVPTLSRYELETEIPLIVNRGNCISLDAQTSDFDCAHEFISSNTQTPLEILLMKEELQSEEHQERKKRINQWNRWWNREGSKLNFSNLQ